MSTPEVLHNGQVGESNDPKSALPIKQSIARLKSTRAMNKVFEENYDVLEMIGND